MKCMLILCMYMYVTSQKFNTTVCTIIILCCSLFEYMQAKAIILWNLVCTKINGMYIIACLLMDMYILKYHVYEHCSSPCVSTCSVYAHFAHDINGTLHAKSAHESEMYM